MAVRSWSRHFKLRDKSPRRYGGSSFVTIFKMHGGLTIKLFLTVHGQNRRIKQMLLFINLSTIFDTNWKNRRICALESWHFMSTSDIPDLWRSSSESLWLVVPWIKILALRYRILRRAWLAGWGRCEKNRGRSLEWNLEIPNSTPHQSPHGFFQLDFGARRKKSTRSRIPPASQAELLLI